MLGRQAVTPLWWVVRANLAEKCVREELVEAGQSGTTPAGKMGTALRSVREAEWAKPPFRSPAVSSGTSITAQSCP